MCHRYLDDRPIFDDERLRAEAFIAKFLETDDIKASQAAEREVLERLRKEKREKDERNFRAMEQIMVEGRRIREQENMRRNDNPDLTPTSAIADPQDPPLNPHTGEPVLNRPENESLRLIREGRLDKWEQRAQPTSGSLPVVASLPPPPLDTVNQGEKDKQSQRSTENSPVSKDEKEVKKEALVDAVAPPRVPPEESMQPEVGRSEQDRNGNMGNDGSNPEVVTQENSVAEPKRCIQSESCATKEEVSEANEGAKNDERSSPANDLEQLD